MPIRAAIAATRAAADDSRDRDCGGYVRSEEKKNRRENNGILRAIWSHMWNTRRSIRWTFSFSTPPSHQENSFVNNWRRKKSKSHRFNNPRVITGVEMKRNYFMCEYIYDTSKWVQKKKKINKLQSLYFRSWLQNRSVEYTFSRYRRHRHIFDESSES